ncbi:MAG: formylglycine-generating enzyme family protein [Deltaproteobacteria bacterium]|nr:formylglycine-generating enzyme family protein [Deltaproteobacteria bacterium]
MTTRSLHTVLALLGLTSACGGESTPTLPPPGHHVVTIDTDAIVPPDPMRTVDAKAPIPLFDRLELAVLRDGETTPEAENVRDFQVDASRFTDGGASFTVQGMPGERVRVRARLSRTASTFGGVSRPESTIEVTAALPPTPDEGSLATTLLLLTEDVGVPQGSSESPLEVDAAESALVRPSTSEPSRVRTWAQAAAVPCKGEPLKSETCIEGGAYWMGNPLVKGDDFVESDRQRLVVLSPYFLDTREVRVGELRTWLATQPKELADKVVRRGADLTKEDYFCTYSDVADPANDALPANCLGWEVASAYCKARGGELPSEAQFEYASSELRSALFVWGTDEAPLCEAAVWGRSGLEGSAIAALGSSECQTITGKNGAQPLPDEPDARNLTRLTDRITIGGVEVFDLAGNLQEWVRDRYNKQTEPCWQLDGTNVFFDPVCTTPGSLGGRSVRGGSWLQDREFLRAAYRASRADDEGGSYAVGFRCARPAG